MIKETTVAKTKAAKPEWETQLENLIIPDEMLVAS